MNKFIEQLERFNRKERYHLLNFATKTEFGISDALKDELSKDDIHISEGVIPYVAMDYHLDWISACLVTSGENSRKCSYSGRCGKKDKNRCFDLNDNQYISGTQEDIDLLIAFPEGEITKLLLIEAKADTPWNEPQLKHKTGHLFGDHTGKDGIFGWRENKWKYIVEPYFILMSPNEPPFKMNKLIPDWIKTFTIKLPMDSMDKVSRCTKGKKSKNTRDDYSHWFVK